MNAPFSQDLSNDADEQANVNNGKWTTAEHAVFLTCTPSHHSALEKHGCDWANIAADVRTRTPSQVRSHAQKYFNKQANDHDRIGYNKTAIIGGETDATRTRSRLAKPKVDLDHRRDHQARKDLQDSPCPTPARKKPIQKEKKSRQAERPARQLPETIAQVEEAKNPVQLTIVLPSEQPKPAERTVLGGERESGECYWIQTM